MPRFSLFQQKYKSLEVNQGFLLLDTKERQRLHSLLSISPDTIPEVSTSHHHSTHDQEQVEGQVEEDIPENADVPRLRDHGAVFEEFLLRRRAAVLDDRGARAVEHQEAMVAVLEDRPVRQHEARQAVQHQEAREAMAAVLENEPVRQLEAPLAM